MNELPSISEEDLNELCANYDAKQTLKEKRIQNGGPVVLDDSTLQEQSTMTMEEREKRWGFTFSELEITSKVVRILSEHPELYVGDQYLAQTRLYTMISRDTVSSRKHFSIWTKLTKQERKAKARQMLAEDRQRIQRAGMKQERDKALRELLSTANPLVLEEVGDHTKLLESAASLAPDVRKPMDDLETTQNEEHNPKGDAGDEVDGSWEMNRWQKCHICKQRYTTLHHFYYSLCPSCAEFNYAKRVQQRDMSQKVCLVTGCRIKIGYAIVLSLLRNGAEVIGTTRFVADSYIRFSSEPDYSEWKDRLHLFCLDMRDLWMVTQFCSFITDRFPEIYLIMNNAAQTIQRPAQYSQGLRSQEHQIFDTIYGRLQGKGVLEWYRFYQENSSDSIARLEDCTREIKDSWPLLQQHATTDTEVLVSGGSGTSTCITRASNSDENQPKFDQYDAFQEYTDVRKENSWTLKLNQVKGSEAAEVMAINALAPFIINSKLKPSLLRGKGKRYIVNVSAMEGMFYRHKLTTHPHTNMAKAALNMMTRTSAADYAHDNIYMNSIDTGWITDESPIQKRAHRLRENMLCPLDEIDAAARCLDLVYTESTENGKFWKDYKEIPW